MAPESAGRAPATLMPRLAPLFKVLGPLRKSSEEKTICRVAAAFAAAIRAANSPLVFTPRLVAISVPPRRFAASISEMDLKSCMSPASPPIFVSGTTSSGPASPIRPRVGFLTRPPLAKPNTLERPLLKSPSKPRPKSCSALTAGLMNCVLAISAAASRTMSMAWFFRSLNRSLALEILPVRTPEKNRVSVCSLAAAKSLTALSAISKEAGRAVAFLLMSSRPLASGPEPSWEPARSAFLHRMLMPSAASFDEAPTPWSFSDD